MKTFNRLFRRYEEVRRTYVGNITYYKSLFYIVDFLKSYILYGASFNDYFGYKFFNLNHNGRKEFITLRKTRKMQKICNENDYILDFRDKVRFNNFYCAYLGRKWLDVSQSTFIQFDNFLKEVGDRVFVKDINGLCGIGISCLNINEIQPRSLYDKLKSDKYAKYLLEEPILQKGLISELHPWSVNTIRITTIYDVKSNKVNIMSAVLRVGSGKDHRDNLHAGGIAAHIDIDTGIIISPGFDKFNNIYISHPITKKQLVGLKIPDWERCKEFISEVASKNSHVKYVGWDIVIKGDGSFLLIEGNDNGDHDVQQLNHKGLWPEYQNVLKNIH